MTLLCNAANLGGTWPAPFVMYWVGRLNVPPNCIVIETTTSSRTCSVDGGNGDTFLEGLLLRDDEVEMAIVDGGKNRIVVSSVDSDADYLYGHDKKEWEEKEVKEGEGDNNDNGDLRTDGRRYRRTPYLAVVLDDTDENNGPPESLPQPQRRPIPTLCLFRLTLPSDDS